MKKYLFLFVIIVSSCHGDYWELGNDYLYCERVIYKQYGDGENQWELPVIMGQVLNFDYDSNFIIAYQVPSRTSFDEQKDFKDFRGKEDSLENKWDEMRSIKKCYWIICKRDGNIYGPLSKWDFEFMCDSLNCTLTLNPQYESKYVPDG